MSDTLNPVLCNNLADNLRQEGLLDGPTPSHVVLGFSGGMDSTALLYLLSELRKVTPLRVTAAYFHHHWRPLPIRELPILHKVTQQCGIPLVMIESDRTLTKTEATAREHRYRQLLGLARDLRADAVLTGHHADDQVETILFRILRGTGLDGLSGIQKRLLFSQFPDSAHIPVLRPMLDISRQSIQELVENRELSYFEDPTNQENHLQRNLIRNKILPALMSDFPHVKNALFKLGLVADGDARLLDDQVDRLWRQVCHQDEYGDWLDIRAISPLDKVLQRRLMKRFFIRHHLPFDYQRIEEALAFIRGETRHDLSSGLKSMGKTEQGQPRFLSLYQQKIRIITPTGTPDGRPAGPVLGNPPIDVAWPGVMHFEDHGMTLAITALMAEERAGFEDVEYVLETTESGHKKVYVDLSRYLEPLIDPMDPRLIETMPPLQLTLRTRQPGDQFQPLGMEWPMRLKKFLMNRGIPRFERDRVPLICVDNTVLWVVGHGISDRIKVRNTPTHVLQLMSTPEWEAEQERAQELARERARQLAMVAAAEAYAERNGPPEDLRPEDLSDAMDDDEMDATDEPEHLQDTHDDD
ncbi:MAG: tRNA lysidine(34) synthetase TilS [Candidatus Melainabacteria bacterium]